MIKQSGRKLCVTRRNSPGCSWPPASGTAAAVPGRTLSIFIPWVEQGIAPDQIIASKVVNGVTTFSRPLCPYPALPRYSGTGDPTQASSFKCVADEDHDDYQPPTLKYLDDGNNYPIDPIDDSYYDHGR